MYSKLVVAMVMLAWPTFLWGQQEAPEFGYIKVQRGQIVFPTAESALDYSTRPAGGACEGCALIGMTDVYHVLEPRVEHVGNSTVLVFAIYEVVIWADGSRTVFEDPAGYIAFRVPRGEREL